MPAIPPFIRKPLWDETAALLPQPQATHPLGHRPRIPDRVVFDKLLQVLVFGCGDRRIAARACSATTLRPPPRRMDHLGVAEQLRLYVLAAYDRLLGLSLYHLAAAVAGIGAVRFPRRGGVRRPSPPTVTISSLTWSGPEVMVAPIASGPLLRPRQDGT